MKMLNNVFSNMDSSSQILLFLIILVGLMLISICIINAITRKRNQRYAAKFNPIDKYISVMDKKEVKKPVIKTEVIKEEQPKKIQKEEVEVMEEPEVIEVISEDNSIDKIAMLIEDNESNKKPIDLTKFEEEEERNAIISYDELVKKAGAKKIVYKTQKATINESKPEVKIEAKEEPKGKFKASEVISPIYGIQRNIKKDEVEEFIELEDNSIAKENNIEDKEYENDMTFLTSLKTFRSNLD